MRKQTKLAVVVSAAALVAIGASMTAMAAAGWQQENGQWVYLNSNGDYVYDEWKRSGDNYFYLGSDGYMVTDSLIDDNGNYYYVDANGAMVKNDWKPVAADDSENADIDHRWYYFGPTGRAYRSTTGFVKKTIEGKKYAFNQEGKMLYGWVTETGDELNTDYDNPCLEADYYFGPNDTTTINGVTYVGGAMHTGWYEYLDGIDQYADEGKNIIWFYFNPSNGKKVVSDEKKIGNYYYYFDANGVMASGWTTVASGTGSSYATANKYFSGEDEGWRQRNTWVWAVPSSSINETDNQEGNYRWFYVGSNGKPVADQAKKINGKWYVFDGDGIMKSGLVILENGDSAQPLKAISSKAHYTGSIDAEQTDGAAFTGDPSLMSANPAEYDGQAIYYFGNDEETDGSMKTGTNVQIELADGTYTFGFASSGRAYDGVNKSKLYRNGVLLTGGDSRYAVKYDYSGDSTTNKNYGAAYVVGPTGTFAGNNSSVRDTDDNFYVSVGGYVFFIESSDYASRFATAIRTMGTRDTATGYTWKNDGLYIKIDGEDVKVEAECLGRTQHNDTLKSKVKQFYVPAELQ